MKDITSSVYNFEKLRQAGYLYVDKTEYIWKLINPAGESYFLSRPRRFGKSLTVSTLKAVFEGKKELFQGLAIYDKPYDWKPYPVIHLDMANCDVHSESDLRDYLVRLMERLTQQHNVQVKIQRNLLASSFSDLIEEVARQVDGISVFEPEAALTVPLHAVARGSDRGHGRAAQNPHIAVTAEPVIQDECIPSVDVQTATAVVM